MGLFLCEIFFYIFYVINKIMTMRRLTFFFGILLILTVSVNAQVTISPTVIFLDQNSSVGSFFISNPSNEVKEVQIGFEFAYPATNQEGVFSMVSDDEEAAQIYSLAPDIRTFPTTFVLQPNQRQTVRLLANLSNDRDDRLYWARMRVTSSSLTPPIEEVVDGEVGAQVTMQIAQVTAVFQHHGATNTALTIHETEYTVHDDYVSLYVDIEREGNSPFLGSVSTRISDNNGNVVVENRNTTTVYFRNYHRIQIEREELPPGSYTAEITYISQRNDVRPEYLLQIEPVSTTISFTVE